MTYGATVVVGVGVGMEGFVFIVTTDGLRSCGAKLEKRGGLTGRRRVGTQEFSAGGAGLY